MVTSPQSPQRIARLTPLEEVLARIDALVRRVEPRQIEIPAPGCVLAGDVRLGPHPRLALALRDGWAVRSDLTTDASSYAPAPLPAATRVDVGEPLAGDADAVALLDTVVTHAARIEITAPVVAGEGVLPAGGDGDRHVAWLPEGRRFTRLQAAVLAAVGTPPLQVCQPQVRLARSRHETDGIIDAATDFVAGDIVASGGKVCGENIGALSLPLDAALADETADAIVAVGGTGSGVDDRSVHVLSQIGRIEVHGMALTPGETAAFGVVGARPVLLLPGRLDAALAVWLVVGRRLMARLTGALAEEPKAKARLSRKVVSTLGLAELVPVRLRDAAAEPIASGYVPLSALAQADGWILVPADSEGYPPGTEVVIRPWP
jgi:molybdopterin biosynthesis enzyme